MVDWSLARQVARLAAGSGEPGPDPDIAAASLEMEEHGDLYAPVVELQQELPDL